ncbi:MAG TPA: SCO family protein [Steroidobacteraceae bacterium]|nr:SCO family protein [Steroidobacteraceae bacterium]
MNRMLVRLALVPLCFCASAALAASDPVTPAQPATALKAGVLSPAMPAPELALAATDGKPLSLARFRGKVVLLAFGFSNCGEVCPITLTTLAGARKKLGPEAGDVQVVYITVDPERDSAAQMKKFLGAFDPSFVGGVGSRAEIDAAQKSYGISSNKITYANGGYTIGHSSSIYMIDRAGRLRAVMPYGRSSDDFAHDLKILLRS